jgi:hypothetical protein
LLWWRDDHPRHVAAVTAAPPILLARHLMSNPNCHAAGLSTPDTIRAGQDSVVPCVNVGAARTQHGRTGTSLAASAPDRGSAIDRSAFRSPIASAQRRVRSAALRPPADRQSP